ncbi:bifunctional diguanylate cyclase/phosphodiesterase [Priestia koreensis]|uniref:bifunctional diguanylate cyclase/phosphodiesterase n=1 Tax=Priestia koreensis TaxID=284581 RepID=UPI00203B0704|nr:EAL domain-containing protein [Priestia koreensis]MCM3004597.1 EAL domain-containing protein [Priestia koreensis]
MSKGEFADIMNHVAHLHSYYNNWLVGLSFFIALVASYTSFELANRVKASEEKLKNFWIFNGSFALGIGIWSMHFVGMLAFELEMAASYYNLFLVALSVVWSIAGCYGGLFFVHFTNRSYKHLLAASLLMGTGISGMHYTGMAAMEPMKIHYDATFVILSVVIALVASVAALWLAFYSRFNNQKNIQGKIGFSLMMALAITGMHYTGMKAATFYMPMNGDKSAFSYQINSVVFACIITGVALLMFGTLSFLSYFDRRANQQQLMKNAIFESALDAIVVTNEQGEVLNINEEAVTLLGVVKEENIGKNVASIFPMVENLLSMVKRRHQLEITSSTGETKIIELTVTKVVADRDLEYILYIRDITEDQKFAQMLKETNDRYESLFYESPLAIVIHRYSQITSANQEALNIIGASSFEQLKTLSISHFLRKDDWDAMAKDVEDLLKGTFQREFTGQEVQVMTLNQEEKWVTAKSTVIQLNGEKYIQTVIRDVTEQRKAKQALQQLTFYDSLTGLPNKGLFETLAKAAIHKAKNDNQSCAILCIDLDRFKYTNEKHGHQIGDRILKELSRRFQAIMNTQDLLTRFGGDEFLMLVRRNKEEDIRNMAGRILSTVSVPFKIEGSDIYLNTSIGGSFLSESSSSLNTLIRQADLAVDEAKKNGRNAIEYYQESMQAYTTRRMVIESGLRTAIQNNEFELYYQPKIDLETGRLTGVEALIRWHHPTLGLVSPGEFISVAEETGLIVPLSKWTLREACVQNKRWHDKGYYTMKVGVNISSIDFARESFVEAVLETLRENDICPNSVELEITESVAIQNVDDVIEKLQTLKDIGVHISIDDFGSGYSSFSYLKKLPINTLKIDRSFIIGLSTSVKEQAIVRAIITLAKSLDLSVIAEGVELPEQVDILKQEKCDAVQGYYYSRPLPVQEFEQWYEQTYQSHVAN